MIVVNTETVPGRKILELKGLVQGNTIRAKHAGRDIAASFKNLVGGEIGAYQQLLSESRAQALERMEKQAEDMGADEVVAVRISTSSIANAASEVLAYGTAVKLR